MTAGEARDWVYFLRDIGGGWWFVIVIALIALTVFLQRKTKIKLWTWAFRALGRAINGEVIERIGTVEKQIGQLEDRVKKSEESEEERNAKLSRTRILRFNGELIRRQRHTHEEFRQAIRDVDDYEDYCKSHPRFMNGEAQLSIENIRAQYRKCMDQGDFLPEVMVE